MKFGMLVDYVIRPCLPKIIIFQKFIFVFDKIAFFYPKIKFRHTSQYFDLLSIISRVLHNSTHKTQKNKTFKSRYVINDTRFAFLDFNMSS